MLVRLASVNLFKESKADFDTQFADVSCAFAPSKVQSTFDATVVIVDELTPPTLLTVAAPDTSAVPLNVGLV